MRVGRGVDRPDPPGVLLGRQGIPPVAGGPGEEEPPGEDAQDERGEGRRAHRAAPGRRGLDAQRPRDGARGDAGEAGEALVGRHPGELRHLQVRRAGLRAQVAVDARGRVARDLEGREERERPEEGPVGAEIAAPGVRDDDREKREADEHLDREGREPLEEVEHLHVGHAVVGRVEEVGDRGRAHLEEDGVDEEREQQVLERAQRQVEEARQAELPAEEPLRDARQHLRERADRADPGAEGLLGEHGDPDHQQQDREAGGVDGVDLAAGDEVAQGEERRDRQEPLDSGRSLAHEAAGLEAVHPAHELPADEGHGQQEPGLDEVAGPAHAPPARPERGALQDVGRGNRVEPGEGPHLLEGGPGKTVERRRTHRKHSSPGPLPGR